MAETEREDTLAIEGALDATRKHYLVHLVLTIALAVWFVASLKSLETTAGKIRVAVLGVISIQLVFAVRGLVRARKGGPVAAAVVAPGQLASAAGWPNIKLPPGRHQTSLRLETVGGQRATLRVPAGQMPRLVAALHRRSPDADITVQNVMLTASTRPRVAAADEPPDP
jgi:hypothetical protein